ncbi:MAG TPA: hypothetical protein VE591_15570 [Candidatus Acidoferrum sp.]|nr:hypothetical protein [Candidatus Acidoferrum sp.]
MIADALTAERIGLDWLRSALAPVGAFGRRHDESIAPYEPGDEARARAEIAEVVALAARLDADGVARVRAALRAVPEPAAIVARARVGDALSDVDFYELSRFVDALDALARAWDAEGGALELRPPVLDRVRAMLAPGRREGGFYLAEGFGPELGHARTALTDAEANVERRREAIAARLRAGIGVDPVGEEFVVLREVYDGPLLEGVQLVRETPTYRVFTIGILAPERDAALARVAEAEERARLALAERIAQEADAIVGATRALGILDRTLARVAFAQRWGGCVPDLIGDRVTFEEATFAPLADALFVHGRRYTPLTLDLDGVAVLTGPNMGGKSASLATTGFLCACVTLGVPPPARAAALPLLDAIVAIGGEGPAERARLLSAYAAEVVRARETLARTTSRTLVLVDEFARTTGPREGRALLVAFVEALRARRAFALVATHFEGVAEAARVVHLRIAGLRGQRLDGVGVDDLDAALDAINAAMDYRIVDASEATGESDALALAALLGLDGELVARARAIHDAPREPA